MSLTIEREFQWSYSIPDTCSSWVSNLIFKLISDKYVIVWWINTAISAEGEVSNSSPVLQENRPYFVNQWGTKNVVPCGSAGDRAYLCISIFLNYKWKINLCPYLQSASGSQMGLLHKFKAYHRKKADTKVVAGSCGCSWREGLVPWECLHPLPVMLLTVNTWPFCAIRRNFIKIFWHFCF